MKRINQWLYLPALERVKRIASNNKSGPFMGSEFAYEDLSSQEVEKFTYKLVRDERYEGREPYVVERFPTYEHSGYTRQIAWIDKEAYQPLNIEFYDRNNMLPKALTNHKYQQYLDKCWRASRTEAVDHQTGKSTTLLWKNHQFSNKFTERDFDQNSWKGQGLCATS